MDAIDSIPGNVEKWAQFLTEACAALEDAKRRIEALEKENALLKKQLADTTPKVDDPSPLKVGAVIPILWGMLPLSSVAATEATHAPRENL
jgi:hypothetical protein